MARLTRRIVLGSMAGLASPRICPAAAETVDRPVKAVVGFPPGGSTDTVLRLHAQRFRGGFAPQMIVENRSGAGGRMAIDAVKAARPDGTTVLFTPASMLTIYPHVYARTLRYDALTDFVPVSPVCAFPFAFAVRADHPAGTLRDFAAWAETQPGAVPFASPAAGSMPHFLGMQLAKALSIRMTHVPYRGTAPALQDLLAGQLAAVCVVLGEVAELYRAGQVRILGISAPERLPRLPALPTFAELGHHELTAEEWFGFLFPARTPAVIVDNLHQAVVAASAMPDLQASLARLEYHVLTASPDELAAQIHAERQRWAPIVAATGFQPEE